MAARILDINVATTATSAARSRSSINRAAPTSAMANAQSLATTIAIPEQIECVEMYLPKSSIPKLSHPIERPAADLASQVDTSEDITMLNVSPGRSNQAERGHPLTGKDANGPERSPSRVKRTFETPKRQTAA